MEWQPVGMSKLRGARGPRFRGFTLLEMMVVMAILAIISLLALSAIQGARETSRRMSCINNLKQIALAVQGYATVFDKFPPINSETRLLGEKKRIFAHEFSAFARILGHLDQYYAYHSINFTRIPWTTEAMSANSTVMRLGIDEFCCPSDSTPPVAGFGRCNYRFSIGPTHRFAPSRIFPESTLGPFVSHETFGPGQFLDGLSNTIGLSERLEGDWQKGSFKLQADYLLTRVQNLNSLLTSTDAIDWCSRIKLLEPHESRGGESWFFSGFHFTNYNHCVPPNAAANDCALDVHSDTIHDRIEHQGLFKATSYHPGGVSAAAMDGSVHFVRDKIDLRVWRALGTRASGEVIAGSY